MKEILQSTIGNEACQTGIGAGGVDDGSADKQYIYDRCRNAAKKGVTHDGKLIVDGQLTQDPTLLEKEYRRSRGWWQNAPDHDKKIRSKMLDLYKKKVVKGQKVDIDIPSIKAIEHVILDSNNSAAGTDGTPYSFWRLCPRITAYWIQQLFLQAAFDPANFWRERPSLTQLLVFIPKKDEARTADGLRPLCLPTTLIRLISAVINDAVSGPIGKVMHQGQALVGNCREPTKNYIAMQHFLDTGEFEAADRPINEQDLIDSGLLTADELQSPEISSDTRVAILADINKAFERVDPGWIISILQTWQVPTWVVWIATFLMTGRQVRFSIGRVLLGVMKVAQGIDMGAGASPFFFNLGLDPILCIISAIKEVRVTAAYMDDLAVGANLDALNKVQKILGIAEKGLGLKMDQHNCARITCQHACTSGNSIKQSFNAHSCRECANKSSINTDQGLANTNNIVTEGYCRKSWSTPYTCNCQCKLNVIPHRALTIKEWGIADATPWGARVVKESGVYLGLYLTSKWRWSIGSSPRDQAQTATWRTQINYKQPIAKARKRTQDLLHVGLNLGGRVLAWNVYIVSLFSYVGQVYYPDTITAQSIHGIASQAMHSQWWIGIEGLYSFATSLQWKNAPTRIEAIAAGGIVANALRSVGNAWTNDGHNRSTHTDDAAHILRECRDICEDPRTPPHVSKLLNNIDKSLQQNINSNSIKLIGRCIKKIWTAKFSNCVGTPYVTEKIRHLPFNLNIHHIIATAAQPLPARVLLPTIQWALNGVATNTRIRWIHDNSKYYNYNFCSICNDQVYVQHPIRPYGNLGDIFCNNHWALKCQTHTCPPWTIPWISLHDTTSDDPVIKYPHFFPEGIPTRDAATTITASASDLGCCLLCGFFEDSTLHYVQFCPVRRRVFQIFLNLEDTADIELTSDNVYLDAACISGLHYFLYQRRATAIDNENPHETLQENWHVTVHKLLQHLWDVLPDKLRTQKFWHERLADHKVEYGLPLNQRQTRQPRPTVTAGHFIALNAVSKTARIIWPHILSRVCGMCEPCWKQGVAHHHIAYLARRPIRAHAPFPILQKRKAGYFCKTPVRGLDVISMHIYKTGCNKGRKKLPACQKLGMPANAYIHKTICPCGYDTVAVIATRPIDAHEEVFLLPPCVNTDDNTSQVIVTFDGGLRFPRLAAPAAGAAVVGLLYTQGLVHKLGALLVPLPDVNSAQVAERTGGVLAEQYVTRFVRQAQKLGFSPKIPDIVIGDSKSTIGALNNKTCTRSRNLQVLHGNRNEALAFRGRPLVRLHTARTQNPIADKECNKAIDMLLTARAIGDADIPTSFIQYQDSNLHGGLQIHVSPEARHHRVDIHHLPLLTTYNQIQSHGWIQELSRQLGDSNLQNRISWSIEKPEFSDIAAYYAHETMLARGNHTGVQLYHRWAKSIQNARNHDDDEDTAGLQGYILVWYTTKDHQNEGRRQARSPGGQSIPKTLRALVYGSTHNEFDMVGCHLSILASVIEVGQADAIRRVWLELRANKAKIPKQFFSSLLNAHNPSNPSSLQRTAIREHLNSNHGHDASCNRQCCQPHWLENFCQELHQLKRFFIQELNRRGYSGPREYINDGNALYYAMESVEAAIIGDTLQILTQQYSLFSFAYIHDAILIENHIPQQDVVDAFQKASSQRGFNETKIGYKDCREYVNKAVAEVEQNYTVDWDLRDTWRETKAYAGTPASTRGKKRMPPHTHIPVKGHGQDIRMYFHP